MKRYCIPEAERWVFGLPEGECELESPFEEGELSFAAQFVLDPKFAKEVYSREETDPYMPEETMTYYVGLPDEVIDKTIEISRYHDSRVIAQGLRDYIAENESLTFNSISRGALLTLISSQWEDLWQLDREGELTLDHVADRYMEEGFRGLSRDLLWWALAKVFTPEKYPELSRRIILWDEYIRSSSSGDNPSPWKVIWDVIPSDSRKDEVLRKMLKAGGSQNLGFTFHSWDDQVIGDDFDFKAMDAVYRSIA